MSSNRVEMCLRKFEYQNSDQQILMVLGIGELVF